MIIRKATSDDAASIAKVHVASWQSTYKDIMPDDVLANLNIERRLQYWQQVIAKDASDVVLLIVEKDNKIIGFISGGKPQESVEDYDGELYATYLLSEVQGQGIGRKLVQAFAEEMQRRGFKNLVLWVLADNTHSKGFYEHLGGTIVTEGEYRLRSKILKKLAYGWSDINTLITGGKTS